MIDYFHFNYISDNLEEILENPNRVLYLRRGDVGNKRALFAIIKQEDGVYKKLQITKEQGKGIFPTEPFYVFKQGPGYNFLDGFICIDNMIVLNMYHLENFVAEQLDEKKNPLIGIYAGFDDGSATLATAVKGKNFIKSNGIEAYRNILKELKGYDPKHDTYQVIESIIFDNDTLVIPELQGKKDDLPLTRKLTK